MLTSPLLAATTPLPELLLGLQRLRAPALVITIATPDSLYVDVIAGEAARFGGWPARPRSLPRFLFRPFYRARVGSLFVRPIAGRAVHLHAVRG